MKIIVAFTLVIVFISVFFIFFIFDNLINSYINCLNKMDNNLIQYSQKPGSPCDVKSMGLSFVTGFMIIGLLVLIDIAAVHLAIKFQYTTKKASFN